MDLYSSGVIAIRDTTKWLVSFVPVVSVLGLIGVGTARLHDGSGIDRCMAVGAAIAAGGIAAIVVNGARVLNAAPQDFTSLLADPHRLSLAFGAGVGSPYFDTEEDFRGALARLSVHWTHPPEADTSGAAALDSDLKRVVPTTSQLRSWATFDNAATRFSQFRWWLAGGIAAIGIGTVLMLVGATEPRDTSQVDESRSATLELSSRGERRQITAQTRESASLRSEGAVQTLSSRSKTPTLAWSKVAAGG